MRKKRAILRGARVLVALVLATGTGGCNAVFCDIQDCTGNGGSGQGGGGSGGGAPIQCELVDGQPIAASCGVFVKAGATGGNGSQAKPFGAFEDAASKLGSKGGTIYACAGSFTGSITIPAGISVVGGVDCANGFLYDSTKSTSLVGDEDAPAILFSGGTGAGALRGFAVTAPPANDDSGSSIGVIVNDMPFTFEHVTITTGDAKPGAQQNVPPKTNGNDGLDSGCTHAQANAPCDGAGAGGLGGLGMAGLDGAPVGMGGGAASSLDCSVPAGIGLSATTPGEAGAGQQSLGVLSTTGFGNPPDSAINDGKPGAPGSGGGGGAGKPLVCNGNADPGYGGDGGNGGCAGRAGKAGNPGGSSIAVIVLGAAAPTFIDVRLSVGGGGNGGDGQPGGPGGDGGAGGKAGATGCAGGAGGKGSAGGKGGGGAGGHSVGVAHEGLTLDLGGIAMADLGVPGSGGAMDGGTGQSCRALSFPDGACEP